MVDILQAAEIAPVEVVGEGWAVVSLLRFHARQCAYLRAVRVGRSAVAVAVVAGALAGDVLGGNRAESGVRQRLVIYFTR